MDDRELDTRLTDLANKLDLLISLFTEEEENKTLKATEKDE